MKRLVCILLLLCISLCVTGFAGGTQGSAVLQPVLPRLVIEDLDKDTNVIRNSIAGEAVRRKTIDPSFPMVALTFDDGPYKDFTNDILDILDDHKVAATFFVVGYRISSNTETLLRAFDAGHELANHTEDHRYLTRLPKDNIISQIVSVNEELEALTGTAPTFLRPPYGDMNSRVRGAAKDLGMPLILWSIDPSDYLETRSPEEIVEFIMERMQDGAVILLHDKQELTVDAVRLLVPALLEENYQFVTVSELFYYNDIEYEPGVAYGYRTIRDLFNKRPLMQMAG